LSPPIVADTGGLLRGLAGTTDLPFKVSDTAIVILKGLPDVQCVKCLEYLIEGAVLRRVDEILARVAGGAEREIIHYAA
jgi:hypothetical protein